MRAYRIYSVYYRWIYGRTYDEDQYVKELVTECYVKSLDDCKRFFEINRDSGIEYGYEEIEII